MSGEGNQELPADLARLIGQTSYYRARNDDFLRREPATVPPDYYLAYGEKYALRFSVELRPQLTPEGQAWVLRALALLQELMEARCEADRAAFAALELRPEDFRSFAFSTHPQAYLDAGLASLPPVDVIHIVDTPDLKDLMSHDGLRQVVVTALGALRQDGVTGVEHFAVETLEELASWDTGEIRDIFRACLGRAGRTPSP